MADISKKDEMKRAVRRVCVALLRALEEDAFPPNVHVPVHVLPLHCLSQFEFVRLESNPRLCVVRWNREDRMAACCSVLELYWKCAPPVRASSPWKEDPWACHIRNLRELGQRVSPSIIVQDDGSILTLESAQRIPSDPEAGLMLDFVKQRMYWQLAPYIYDIEWGVKNDEQNVHMGDLLLTDGRGIFLVVELKYLNYDATGRTASEQRRKGRRLLEKQRDKYRKLTKQKYGDDILIFALSVTNSKPFSGVPPFECKFSSDHHGRIADLAATLRPTEHHPAEALRTEHHPAEALHPYATQQLASSADTSPSPGWKALPTTALIAGGLITAALIGGALWKLSQSPSDKKK